MKKFIEKLIGRLEEISVENTCSDCPYKAKCDEVQENIKSEHTDLCGATIKALAIDTIKELAEEYKDAEEQGLLLRLPCKVGDTVYSVIKDGLSIFELEFSLDFYVRRKDEFGKTVFLTKEEAEQALKQIGE